jgi:transposase
MSIASKEIRKRALEAHLNRGLTQARVARNYNVHITTFQRWLFDFRQSGSCEPKKRGHRQAVFSGNALTELERLVKNNPDATLEELREMSGTSVSIVTVHNSLQRLGYRYKKNAPCRRARA